VSYFTLRIIIILMETIKGLYQTPTPRERLWGDSEGSGHNRSMFDMRRREFITLIVAAPQWTSKEQAVNG